MLFEEAQNIYSIRVRIIIGGIVWIIMAAAVIITLTGGGKNSYQWALFFLSYPILISIGFMRKMKVSLSSESLEVKCEASNFTVPVSDIKSVRAEECDRSKIGWRWSWHGNDATYKGKRYYIAPDAKRGVWIILHSGDPFFVSSERPEEFVMAVNVAIGNAAGKARN